jgi:hypothetical protein
MIEHVFEGFTDAALIDAMGEATGDEPAAIARRFASYFPRRRWPHA